MIDAVQSVTPEELRELARRYLVDDRFYIVVAGNNLR
jgi:predicted Zn-dependent peptidase